jgi:hypothetical protein
VTREKLIERLHVRVDEPLLRSIERVASRLEASAGCRVSRGEVARAALERGIEVLTTSTEPVDDSEASDGGASTQ